MAGSSVITGIIRHGRLSKALAGDVTLTEAEQKNTILEFTGSVVGNVAVTLQSATDGHMWVVYNNGCSGNLTLKVSGATGVAIANGKRALVYCDGTDVRRVTADNP